MIDAITDRLESWSFKRMLMLPIPGICDTIKCDCARAIRSLVDFTVVTRQVHLLTEDTADHGRSTSGDCTCVPF